MIELIPAIDIIDGKCVRLAQGNYDRRTVYSRDPLEIAMLFESNGLRRLHVVDLDGAKSHHIVNWRVLERIASHTGLIVDFGGGLKSDDDLRIAFESGAQMITGGSIAVKEPDTFLRWLDKYGPDHIILGADVRDDRIAVSGWQEETILTWRDFLADYCSRGIRKAISTDIARDGMLAGPAIELYRSMMEAQPELYVIASGGVSSVDDILALDAAGVPAVIFGKAIYEGRITMRDLLPLVDCSTRK